MRLPTYGEWLAIYALGAVLTFGFSFNHDYVVPTDRQGEADNLTRAIASGMVWPVYISKCAFEGVRK